MVHQYKANSLFRAGPYSSLNACVGTNGGPYEFEDYGEGFFTAGFQIIEVIRLGNPLIDILIYPAAFSFRHGMELYIKGMQILYSGLADSLCTYQKTHSLFDNWDTFAKGAASLSN